jgi:hypothetical protein
LGAKRVSSNEREMFEPEELGRFLTELLEKATEDHKKAALIAAPAKKAPDLSVLTNEELELAHRLAIKIHG